MRRDNRVNSVVQVHQSFDDKISQSASVYRKKYQMSNSTQQSLAITKRDIKFITVNMLNMNLREIDFSDNKINYLPDDICDLNSLSKFTCERNHLRLLPDKIGKLKSLITLNLSCN